MSIQDSTIKRLFGMSRNQCASPACEAPIIIGNIVVGEICHIRARRKGGARFDPQLTAAQKDQFENLILLCSTCHKLIDLQPSAYPSEWLQNIKASHERKTQQPLELSAQDSQYALMILAKHQAKFQKTEIKTTNVSTFGCVHSSATHGGMAFAFGGANNAPINVRVFAPKAASKGYPANSIGADANMTNYVEYLCDLYVKYMKNIEPDENVSWGKIGKHIKSKFHLKKKTRNHLSAERFWDLVHYLHEKLALTPVGMSHIKQGTKLCRTFDEFRHGAM